MATTTVGRTTIQGATTVGGFNPATLFSAGEQGVWYDPSDLSTLFQDSAGTIPVTALEQPVGRMLDKSGRGNHATQATSANRPVVSARVNLLTYTENFSNAAWNLGGTVTVTTDAILSPIGTLTADKLVEATTTNQHGGYQLVANQIQSTFSVFAKAAERTAVSLRFYNATSQYLTVTFNLSSGTVSQTSNVGGIYSAVTSSITDAGGGWYRCSVTSTRASGSTYYAIDLNTTPTPTLNATGYEAYMGDVTKGLYLWGADLRPTNQGVGLPVYQRVGAAVAGTSTTVGNADYDANGFPVYLKFDGSNDSLATGNINFSPATAVSLFSGVRKLNDSIAIVAELSTNTGSNANSFYIVTGQNPTASDRYSVFSRGTAAASSSLIAYNQTGNAPETAIISGSGDIPGDLVTIRKNGVAGTSGTGDQGGSGPYGNYPLYVGARGGSSLFFNGNLYGLIVRGASSTANQITGAENWLNQKTAAY